MSLNIVVTADVATAGKQIEDFSKKSRIALTNLSLVAQDLPFGFIGIQNNLPGVISSFGELTREAGSVGGALKQLGNALIGPAGLFFAFSVTTSIVTSLIQKYGSLGAAITDIFGLQVKQRDLQNSLNVALADTVGKTAGEVANLNSLAIILTSTNSSLKEKNGAYSELNKQYPGILQGLNKEKIATGQLNTQIAERIKLFSTQIELEGKADALRQLISKSAQEQLNLGAKIKTGGYFDVLGLQLKGFFQTGDAGVGGVIKSIQNTFGKTNAESKFFKQSLLEVNKELVGINLEVDKLIKASKKQKDAKGLSKIQRGILGPGSLINTAAAFAAYVKGNINIQKASIDKILRERNAYRRKEIESEIFAPKKIDKVASAPLSAALEAQLGAYQIFIAKLQESQSILTNTFFQPLENAFMNLFETGKFGFKAFADAVLKQIQQLVAKMLASGIISLIANLMTGGFSGVGGTAAGFGRVFQDIFSGFGGGGVANPSFSGVGPGSLGMSGQVNVVLRGSDLVGALNRTNATINRVG